MADVAFPNYGIASGLAEGLKQGLITYQNMKNIQHQNQMQELLTGTQKNPDTGQLQYTPEKQQAIDLSKAENTRKLGLLTGGSPESLERVHGAQKAFDASHASDKNYHGPLGADIFPEDMSGASVEDLAGKGLIGKDVSGEMGLVKAIVGSPMVGVKRDGLNFQKHSAAVKGVADDAPTKNLLGGYQSMQNALTEFKNNPSPQSFHTLQNVARMNAGSNNRSGVNERADQYATDLGIKKDEALQILSGNMQDVNLSSPEMVNAIMKVMGGELSLKQKQAAQQIGKKKKAFASIYSEPGMEGFSQDFNNTVGDQYKQFDLDENGSPVQTEQSAADAKIKRLQELRAKAAASK